MMTLKYSLFSLHFCRVLPALVSVSWPWMPGCPEASQTQHAHKWTRHLLCQTRTLMIPCLGGCPHHSPSQPCQDLEASLGVSFPSHPWILSRISPISHICFHCTFSIATILIPALTISPCITAVSLNWSLYLPLPAICMLYQIDLTRCKSDQVNSYWKSFSGF